MQEPSQHCWEGFFCVNSSPNLILEIRNIQVITSGFS